MGTQQYARGYMKALNKSDALSWNVNFTKYKKNTKQFKVFILKKTSMTI